MTIKPYHTEAVDLAWARLERTSGVAALVTELILLIGAICFAVMLFQPGAVPEWVSLAQDNWLIVLVKLHAGIEGVQPFRLYGLYPLDITVLILNVLVYLGLFAALRKASRVWPVIALVVTILGILLLFVTETAGRSSVMGAGLVISLVMLRSPRFGKAAAWIGILASVLLLVGDTTLSSNHSYPLAALTGIGYVLLAAWYFLIGRRLVSARPEAAEGAEPGA